MLQSRTRRAAHVCALAATILTIGCTAKAPSLPRNLREATSKPVATTSDGQGAADATEAQTGESVSAATLTSGGGDAAAESPAALVQAALVSMDKALAATAPQYKLTNEDLSALDTSGVLDGADRAELAELLSNPGN